MTRSGRSDAAPPLEGRAPQEVIPHRQTRAGVPDLDQIERELEDLVADGPPYAARDASLALADLARRTGRTDEASGRYRELLEVVPEGPLREFCCRYAR